jgi:hypothetical protein
MGLITDTVKATGTNDAGLAGALASASTTDIGAATGNSVIVTGTTTITSLGTASQAGVKRLVVFTDALILTNGSNLICLGGANITTEADDVAEFLALTTTQWRMISYSKLGATTGGLIDTDGILNGAVTEDKLGDASVSYSKMVSKVQTTLTDATGTLTASDFVNGLIVGAITGNIVKTTPTAAQIIALVPGYQTGTNFELLIAKTGAFTVQLVGGVGVTVVGDDSISATTPRSGTWLVVITSPTTVTIYRK